MKGDILKVLCLSYIDFLNEWAPFHSSNGSFISRLGCGPRGNEIQLLRYLSSYFNIWSMKHWRFMTIGQIILQIKHTSWT